MRDRGIPDLESGRRGDQMVRIRIWTPTSLSEEENSQLEQMRESDSFTPRPETQDDSKSFFSRVKDVFS